MTFDCVNVFYMALVLWTETASDELEYPEAKTQYLHDQLCEKNNTGSCGVNSPVMVLDVRGEVKICESS